MTNKINETPTSGLSQLLNITSVLRASVTALAIGVGSPVLALDLTVSAELGDVADAEVSLSLGGGSSGGASAGADINLGGSSGHGGTVDINVAAGSGGAGAGVTLGTGTGGNGGNGARVVPANGVPADTRLPRDGQNGGAGVRCATSGDVTSLIGTEVVDKNGVLVGWVQGATMDGRKLGKVWFKTTEATCRSLQGGMAMVGDRIQVNALASDIR